MPSAWGANEVLSLLQFLKSLLDLAKNGVLRAAPEKNAGSISTSKPINRLNLKRRAPKGEAILGEVSFGPEILCYSLERLGVEIPVGTYKVVMTYSPHFGRDLPELLDVPGRTSIRIHPGNIPAESDGCILVGQSYTPTQPTLVDSRAASDFLNAWVMTNSPIEITIAG